MVKEHGQWKITTLITIDTTINSTATTALENKINTIGYQLLNAKRIKDAIDLFKLNSKFFPQSWNVYDSLGEAYMVDGNDAEAIKNYEISLKLNQKTKTD